MFSKLTYKILLCLALLTVVDGVFRPAKKPDKKCSMPSGRSCTALTTKQMVKQGLAVYFKFPCSGIGCHFYRPYCRICANNTKKVGKPYVACPPCMANVTVTTLQNQTKNEYKCFMPRDRSCSSLTPSVTKSQGLRLYYEYPCRGLGCGFKRPYCRLCVIDRIKNFAPYPKCPACMT
ncbi:unnamed protein product [Adineta steineri]|uniref:Uncharacterized protein n=1 Tax=Adineta steineri TaxID=433720 RepID=A0A818XPI6_9BILA|nr:unnamed protein product [Adineta steineri]CAF1318303.1 unnamed protein product [Adineta steineri]CAF3743403.1 unnamed protein product [Adineta steineri]CAF3845660.1 unnamed protein product [Adineta steineri]